MEVSGALKNSHLPLLFQKNQLVWKDLERLPSPINNFEWKISEELVSMEAHEWRSRQQTRVFQKNQLVWKYGNKNCRMYFPLILFQKNQLVWKISPYFYLLHVFLQFQKNQLVWKDLLHSFFRFHTTTSHISEELVSMEVFILINEAGLFKEISEELVSMEALQRSRLAVAYSV